MAEAALLARLEAVVNRLEQFANARPGAAAAAGPASDEKSAAVAERVVEYDEYYKSFVQPFIDTCNKIKDTAPLARLTETAWKRVRDLIDAASQSKKADQKEVLAFIAPVANSIQEAGKVDNRSPFAAHLSAFAEVIQCLQWVLAQGPTKAIVEGQLEAADFHLIKILNKAKTLAGDEQATYRAFVAQIKAMTSELAKYCFKHHKAGLEWNPRGGALSAYKAGGAPAAPAAPPVAPPAPPALAPPIAPPVPNAPAPAAAGGGGGMGAVFAAISAGAEAGSATAAFGLKKVTDNMKAKNMKDVPVLEAKAKPAPAAAAPKNVAAAVGEKRGEPRLHLDKGTWFVENYDAKDAKELVIPDVQVKQNIYIIRCRGILINIPDKCKAITVDKCEKIKVQFKAVVSTFEIVNSQRVTIFAGDACPSVAIDKSSGISVNVSRTCVNQIPAPPEIVTSNISECNLVVPGKTDEDDPIEIAIPEQYLTRYNKANGKITTENVSHGGG